MIDMIVFFYEKKCVVDLLVASGTEKRQPMRMNVP